MRLSIPPHPALDERESVRWFKIFIKGKFSDDPTQLTKDHARYYCTTHDSVQIVVTNATALTKFID